MTAGGPTVTDADVAQRRRALRAERRAEYERLDAHDADVDGGEAWFLVRCPSCGTWMLLGWGWRGTSIPECPSCTSTGDRWRAGADPRVGPADAERLKADDRNLEGLLPGDGYLDPPE